MMREKKNNVLLVKKNVHVTHWLSEQNYMHGSFYFVYFDSYVSNQIWGSDRRCVAFTYDIDHMVTTLRSSNK